MHRNTIIMICAIFCAIAVGAGLLISRSSMQGSISAPPTPPGMTSVAPIAATSQPIRPSIITTPTSAPTPTTTTVAAPATATAVLTTTAAPETTAAPATAAPTLGAVGYIEYTVQKGDILYTIAEKHDVTVEDILAVNQIPNPNSLTVGQVLRIPKK